MKRTFKSAVDWWFYVLLVVVPVTVFVPYIIDPHADELVVVLVVGMLATMLPIWLFFTTVYEVNDELLLIKSGPFRWRVSRESIVKIEPSRSVLSSPALSLDRLKIDYGSGKSILVSPKDRNEFLSLLRGDE